MSRVILEKRSTLLLATDDESVARLLRIKDGTEVYADIRRARNTKQHRLFFALAAVVAEAMDKDVDIVREHALKVLGHVDTYFDFNDQLVIKAKSINHVDGMEQDEFDAFMDKAVNLMATWIGADHPDLMRRYNELAADKRYQDYMR